MATRATAAKRDRVFVEKAQVDAYRELAGTGGTKRTKAQGADLPAFEDLKDVVIAAVCLGLLSKRRTTLRDRQELTRTSYFKEHTDLAVLRGVAIAETGGVEVLADENKVFTIAEEYANAGFAELRRRVLGPGRPLVNLTSFLLEQYEQLFPTGQLEDGQSGQTDSHTEDQEPWQRTSTL